MPLSEQVADAHFIYEPDLRLSRPEPDAEIDHDVLAEFQIASWENLMDLLVSRQQVAQRPDRAVILETQIQPPIQFITQPHARLEVPPFALARPAQRAPDDRIEVYLKPAEFFSMIGRISSVVEFSSYCLRGKQTSPLMLTSNGNPHDWGNRTRGRMRQATYSYPAPGRCANTR